MSLNEETASWEASQRQMIAQDLDLLQQFQVLKYINMGLLAVLVYDYFITLNLEKERIWTLRWKLPKILFMINRYFLPPFLFFDGISNVLHVGQKTCDARLFTYIPTFPANMTVGLLLMLRVFALYENSKYMARYLIFQYIAQFGTCTVLTVIIVLKTRSIAGEDVFTGCILTLPEGYYLSWLSFLFFEVILVFLTVYKCREYGNFSPTTKILATDSLVYFASVTAVLVFNISYTSNHRLLGITLTLPTNICASIAATRLTLNIRSITMGQALETFAQQSRFIPTIIFRDADTVSYGREVVIELEELPREDEDKLPREDEDKLPGEDEDKLDQFL